MADYVRVMISIAAQWRVWRAIGPAATALVGVPVARSTSLPVAPPAVLKAGQPKLRKGGSGKVRPENGHNGHKG
jgi:hypothetical protein